SAPTIRRRPSTSAWRSRTWAASPRPCRPTSEPSASTPRTPTRTTTPRASTRRPETTARRCATCAPTATSPAAAADHTNHPTRRPTPLIVAILLLGSPARADDWSDPPSTIEPGPLPDVRWYTLDTPHFHIHFYEDERALASHTAIVAERAFHVLTRYLNWLPS